MDFARFESVNRTSARRFGWSPSLFGLHPDTFGAPLEEAIRAFQTARGIAVDGWIGAETARRLLTRAVLEGLVRIPEPAKPKAPRDAILIGGELKPIPWDRVVTAGEPGALVLAKGYGRTRRDPAKITAAIVHWPATVSPDVTHRVLSARGISTHFEIAHDGTIYQYVDVLNEAWHAAGRKGKGAEINRPSVGIDVSNPVDVDLNDKLERVGQPRRPVLDDVRINGWRPKPFLGWHDVQVEALSALLAGLAEHLSGFVLEAPAYVSPTEIKRCEPCPVVGVFHHAEVDWSKRGKWDSAGLDLADACARAREIRG